MFVVGLDQHYGQRPTLNRMQQSLVDSVLPRLWQRRLCTVKPDEQVVYNSTA